MATKLLLTEDVESLGRSGDIVSVKPGYARNYLLPLGLGVIADKQALRRQERLRKEREQRALEDKKESETIAAHIEGILLTIVVKVDSEGHMYGSVSAQDIVHLLQEKKKIALEKKNIQLKHAIKSLGEHPVQVKLKEGVVATFNVKVISEEEAKLA